jgi:hypothetical protein
MEFGVECKWHKTRSFPVSIAELVVGIAVPGEEITRKEIRLLNG